MLDVLQSLVSAAIVALSAYGLGRPLLRWAGDDSQDPLGIFVWSMALGLTALGSSLFVLALAGWVCVEAVVAICVPSCLWGVTELACLQLSLVSGRLVTIDPEDHWAPLESYRPPGVTWLLFLAAVVLVAALPAALTPPTASEVLSRSLETPKSLLFEHGIWSSGARQPRPLDLVQMWFLVALALDGPVAVGLVQWCLGLLLALATVLLARVFLRDWAAWLAGGFVVLCPGVQRHLALPLEDLAFALYGTLALESAARCVVRLETKAFPQLGGVALGSALAIQPWGLPLVAAFAAVWLVACRPGREVRRDLIRAASTTGLATLVVAAPWLAQAVALPERAAEQDFRSAVMHVGPFLVAMLPGLAFSRRLFGLDVVLGPLGLYVAMAATLPSAARWWSLVVPLAAVVAAWIWLELGGFPRLPRLVAPAALGLLAALAPIMEGGQHFEHLSIVLGQQSRDEFLLTHEPTYRAASLFNQIRRPGDRLLAQDAHTFYFSCPAAVFGDPARLESAPVDLGEAIAVARSTGCSYLLTAERLKDESRSTDAVEEPAGTRRLAARARQLSGASGQVIPILEYCFADDKSHRVRYSLLKLR